jgi:dimethylamine monooxygenase subunit A
MRRQPYFDGPPRFDVGLKPIALADWLLPDDQAHWLAPKATLINNEKSGVFAHLASSMPAQQEAGDLIAQEYGKSLRRNEAPVLAASRLVSDDLVIMQQIEGQWINTASCLCSPTFFSAAFAVGKSLHGLHDPVPDGDFGLAARIGRVFSNLRDNMILERHNWTVQWSDARFTPDASTMRADAAQAKSGTGASQLFLRVERQTIRRLPKTGAVLFTIRIRLTPLASLLAQPDHRAAFKQAWDNASSHVREYKKWAVLERHVEALLRV